MKRRGFTLIELLVVVAIIGLLASVVTASAATARSKGQVAANKQLDANFSHNLGDSLIGQWLFDNGDLTDSSGFGKHGTPVGGTSIYSTDTPFNTGYSFSTNGGTRSASLPTGTLPATPNRTVSVWVKRDTPTSVGSFVGNGDFQFGVGVLGCLNTNCIKLTKYNVADIYAGTFPADTKWHLAIAVWSTTGVRVYIDGALNGTDPNTQNFTTAANALLLGSQQTAFSGMIDSVRIYDRALETAEVQKLFASEAPKHNVAVK